MDPDLLAILACPKCRGSLELLEPPTLQEDAEGLSCPACSWSTLSLKASLCCSLKKALL